MNDKAQIHTLEGLGAAALITMTIVFITQSAVIVTPQTELFTDVQLKQTASDALTVLDESPSSSTSIQYNLTVCVAQWNKSNEAAPQSGNLQTLDNELSNLLPDNVLYNVDFAYVENDNLTVKNAVFNGIPKDNSVVSKRLVTLYNSTVEDSKGTWNISENEIRVVEVRLTAWKV